MPGQRPSAARSDLDVQGARRPTPPRPGMIASSQFHYEAAVDGYRCPQGQLLAYATTDRTGYPHYKSDPAVCRTCPLLASCTSSRNATRLIIRHAWADARERADAYRLTPLGQAHLQTPERDRRTLLRRRQAASRPPLRALPACSPSLANACSPPPPRTSRRLLSPWRPSPPWPDDPPKDPLTRFRKTNPAENRRGLSAV